MNGAMTRRYFQYFHHPMAQCLYRIEYCYYHHFQNCAVAGDSRVVVVHRSHYFQSDVNPVYVSVSHFHFQCHYHPSRCGNVRPAQYQARPVSRD
jgi:hypothetical protein